MLLSVCLLFAMLPWAVSANEPDEEGNVEANEPTSQNGEVLLNTLLNQISSGDKPSTFDDDTLTPYGTEKNEIFNMLEQAELFTYTSAGGSLDTAAFEDDIKLGSYDWSSVTESVNADSGADGLSALRFARGVAFDPTGCGRRNYVAIVGYSPDSDSKTGSVYLFIINADSKRVEKKLTLRSGDQKLRSVMDALTVVDSANFFQITAGDYNDDGFDSVVVYTGCVSSANSGLYEVSCSDNSWRTNQIDQSNSRFSIYLNFDYLFPGSDAVNAGKKLFDSWAIQNMLNVSMTTGDFNGDGIDDLAVVSCASNMDSSYISYNSSACIPDLRVGFGQSGASTIAGLSVSHIDCDSAIAAAGVSAGDIDGDGVEEIVVAGYKNDYSSSKPHNIENGDVAYNYFKYGSGGFTKKGGTLTGDDVSPISKGDSLRNGEKNVQQFSVECVAFDGLNTREYVFLNGYIFTLNSDGIFVKAAVNSTAYLSMYPLSKLVTKMYGNDIDEVFIYSASVGNLLGNIDGGESIALSVGFKTHTNEKNKAEKEGNYYFANIILSGDGQDSKGDLKISCCYRDYDSSVSNNADVEGDLKNLTVYTVPAFTGSDKKGTSGSSGVSNFMISVDYGYDSVIAKYTGKAYTYTDPAVVAFLQAAPYYSEFDPGNSATTYSYSESYTASTGTSEERSYNIGISAEIETPVVKTGLEAGVATEITEEFTKSIEKTYTTTFEANGENQVVIRQTLMYYYYYDIQDYNETTGELAYRPSALVVSVPQYPVLTTLSMTQYNALASAYNAKVDELKANAGYKNYVSNRYMDVISSGNMEKYFLNNEGNPFAYASNTTDYQGNGFDLYKDEAGNANWISLSHAGGTSSQVSSVSLEEEKSKTVAEGGYTNLTVMAGAEGFGIAAFLGTSLEYEKLVGESYSTAKITTEETGGTVQNLDGEYTDYKFNWKLIGWKTDPDDHLFDGVPFVGYAVQQQSALPQPVNNLAATYPTENSGELLLTWTSPEVGEGRLEIDEFAVYCKNGDELTPVGTVANAGGGKEHRLSVDVSGYEMLEATFVVKSVAHGSPDQYSMESNEASCFLSMTEAEIRELVDQTRKDLETKIEEVKNAVEGGQSDALTAAIGELTDAYTKADKVLAQAVADLADESAGAEKALAEADAQIIAQLNSGLEEARKALQTAISQLQADLEKTASDLAESIAAGDKANADALQNAIDKLSAAHDSANALLKSEIDSNVEDTNSKMEELESSLNSTTTTINQTIASSNEAINTAIEELRKAYTSADADQKARIDNLIRQLEDLGRKMDSELGDLTQEMDSEIANLEEKMDSEISDLTLGVDSEIAALRSELETLREQVDQQNKRNSENVQRLEATVSAQQGELSGIRGIAIMGVGIAILSILINLVLIALSFLKRRK